MAYVEGTECAGKKGDAEPGRRARSLPVGGRSKCYIGMVRVGPLKRMT